MLDGHVYSACSNGAEVAVYKDYTIVLNSEVSQKLKDPQLLFGENGLTLVGI